MTQANRQLKTALNVKLLKPRLDELYLTYDRSFLDSDPLLFPHRYGDRRDVEIVAFLASTLAYGSVVTIKKDVEKVLGILGPHPHGAVVSAGPGALQARLAGFKHRFTTARHMAWFFHVVRRALAEFGGLEALFLEGYDPDAANTKDALTAFVEQLVGYDPRPVYPDHAGVKADGALFLLPSPKTGAACKRLNLFLRWVVRRGDDLDLALWKKVSPSKLVIPLDTHIARISRAIGLTARKSSDWKAAEDITRSLSALDPADPLKYDFAITRLGILGDCVADARNSRCAGCSLAEICVRAREVQ
jgi:uncharacterized protein (TIGR02757 family)